MGAVSRVKNMSIGTHLVSSVGDLIDGGTSFSYLALTIGFIIDYSF